MSDPPPVPTSVPPPELTRHRTATGAFFAGLATYLRVPATLSRLRLWHYQVLPAFLSLFLSTAILIGIVLLDRSLTGWFDTAVQAPWAWLDTALNALVAILSFLVLFLVFVFAHKHIVLVALAPFLGRLAENIIRGTRGEPSTSALDPVASIRRSAIINTRSILLEISVTGALLVAGLVIPILSPFTTPLVFLVESRFAGFGLIDFPLEYRGFSVRDSIRYTKHHRAVATGIGTGYLLLMMVPFFGWMLAPTFGTTAGTIETLDDIKRAEADSLKRLV